MQHEADTGQTVRGLCGDCPFYDHLGGQSQGQTVAPLEAGVCRRESPRYVQPLDAALVPDTLISGIRPGLFPIVRGNQDWCGAHPLRAAYYALGVADMTRQIAEREKEARRQMRAARNAPPSSGNE